MGSGGPGHSSKECAVCAVDPAWLSVTAVVGGAAADLDAVVWSTVDWCGVSG